MSTRQKFFIKISSDCIHALQAHTGVILFFRYNHKGKNKKRRYGLARRVKIDFCIFGIKKGRYREKFYWKNRKKFTGKFSIKILQEKRQGEKNEKKIKKTSG